MGSTSLTLSEELKNRLEEYRHDSHGSWDETLEAILTWVPTPEEISTGCGNPDCDRNVNWGESVGSVGGVYQRATVEYAGDEALVTALYCSVSCADHVDQMGKEAVPENPDRVVIGGHEEPRAELENATFIMDGGDREVGIPVPGAFTGENRNYTGEPVYVINAGRVVQEGVVEHILNDDAWTGILMGYDYSDDSPVEECVPDV